MKHTKGPWKVVYCDNQSGEFWADIRKGNNVICTQMDEEYGVSFDKDTTKANARLIAAAPELLEACIKALNELEPNTVSTQYVRSELEKAIAKAEGGGK